MAQFIGRVRLDPLFSLQRTLYAAWPVVERQLFGSRPFRAATLGQELAGVVTALGYGTTGLRISG